MPRNRSTFTKRQKEQKRQQKQLEKAERKNQRKQEKILGGEMGELPQSDPFSSDQTDLPSLQTDETAPAEDPLR